MTNLIVREEATFNKASGVRQLITHQNNSALFRNTDEICPPIYNFTLQFSLLTACQENSDNINGHPYH
jgi:hypothetical protein